MCGIVGIIGANALHFQSAVRRMMSSLVHRGPDGEGMYASSSGFCLLGHRRLSILDLSPAAAQPMSSADDRFHLSYNGEIYNFKALRAELEQTGVRFVSTGDTEVLLQVLAVWGVQGLARVNGMFAIALWDERDRTLLLARDRFGQKPLYWARVPQAFVFASEIRALMASEMLTSKLDQAGLLSYLSYGSVQEPNTIVNGVYSLPRGCYFLLGSDGSETIRRNPEFVSGVHKNDKVALRELFTTAVDRHLTSDVPIGCFLSGGLDSSAIVAAAAHCTNTELHTLSVVFPDAPEYSEHIYAKNIADKYHTRHREIPINHEELRTLAGKAIQAMDQPTGDGVNTFIVAHAASLAGLKVALSGVGSDELFGGYPSFSDLTGMIKIYNVLRPLSKLYPHVAGWMSKWDQRIGKLVDFFAAPPGVLNAYLVRRRAFTSRQIGLLCHIDIGSEWISGLSGNARNDLSTRIRCMDLPDAIAYMELDLYMGNMLLRDIDVMGMWHSLEIRAPFLDLEFSAAVLNLESDIRVPREQAKWKLNEILGDWIPAINSHRHKQGFVLPFEQWLAGSWRDEVEEGIRELPQIAPFDRAAIQYFWATFLKNPKRVGWFRVWQLFVLSHYLRRHRLVG